jgi:hypothetical protein
LARFATLTFHLGLFLFFTPMRLDVRKVSRLVEIVCQH